MTEPFKNITPFDIVSRTKELKEQYLEYHKLLLSDVKNKLELLSLLKSIVTPQFVGMYASTTQGMVIKELSRYVDSITPIVKVPVMVDKLDDNGKPVKDGRKIVKVPMKDENGNIVFVDEKLDTAGWSAIPISNLVEQYYMPYVPYWSARGFVERNMSTIDERMFDVMNDYLWRSIMAVKYPHEVKREFKHLCVTIKRKLWYLGDRNKVKNQTLFGLYDLEKGGNGKTTLLSAFARAFSDNNPVVVDDIDSFFKFNGESADKFGVAFYDEDHIGSSASVKDKVKKFTDSATRKVERKCVEATTVNNLLTLVVAANHKISQRVFEDEARGQRRDATFEVIGLLQQYDEEDMTRWFAKMFAYCPIDDTKTYHHANPHSGELTDMEFSILAKINSNVAGSSSYKLCQLAEKLELKSRSPEWYALKSLLKMRQFFDVRVDHDKSKFYVPNLVEIAKRVGCSTVAFDDWWSIEWRDTRPWIDVDATMSHLEAEKDTYDTESPIDYSAYEKGEK